MLKKLSKSKIIDKDLIHHKKYLNKIIKLDAIISEINPFNNIIVIKTNNIEM
jgi:hypothetical protein